MERQENAVEKFLGFYEINFRLELLFWRVNFKLDAWCADSRNTLPERERRANLKLFEKAWV